MKKETFNAIFILVSLAIIGLAFFYFNLNVAGEPKKSDLIIVPEGPGIERAQKSLDLINAGYSKSGKIIVSPFINEESGTDFRGHYHEILEDNDQAVIQENEASSTWSNAVLTLDIMDKQGYKSAIIVSSDYHTRRVRYAYEKVNQDYHFDLTYVAAYPQDEREHDVPYWDHSDNRRYALNELPKLLGYWLGLYHIIDL